MKYFNENVLKESKSRSLSFFHVRREISMLGLDGSKDNGKGLLELMNGIVDYFEENTDFNPYEISIIMSRFSESFIMKNISCLCEYDKYVDTPDGNFVNSRNVSCVKIKGEMFDTDGISVVASKMFYKNGKVNDSFIPHVSNSDFPSAIIVDDNYMTTGQVLVGYTIKDVESNLSDNAIFRKNSFYSFVECVGDSERDTLLIKNKNILEKERNGIYSPKVIDIEDESVKGVSIFSNIDEISGKIEKAVLEFLKNK